MILSMQRFLKKNAREGLGFVMMAALIFGLVSVPVAFQKQGSSMWALRINGQPVSYARFVQEVFQYKEFISSLKSTYGQFANYILSSMGMGTDPEQIAINKLIHQELLDQLGSTIGVQVHSDYVLSKIKDREFMRNFISEASMKSDGTFDVAMLRKELSYYGMSTADFERILYTGISRDFFIKLFEIGFYVPRFDTDHVSSVRHAAHDISIIEFSYEKVLERVKKEPILEESARNYCLMRNKSSMQYWSSEYRDGVVFKVDRLAYDVVVSDRDIVSYYEQNKSKKYIKTPAKIIVQKITSSDLAQHFPEKFLSDVSNGDEYASLWQDVSPFSRGTYEEAFERAAFGLKKTGDLSPVVTLADGTSVILRLVGTVAREYKSIDSVRESIRNELSINGFKKQFIEEANTFIRQSEIERFAGRDNVVKSVISRIVQDNNDPITKHLFQIKHTGDAIAYVDKDYGYIIQLSHVYPSVEQDFEQVKDVVFNDIYAENAQQEMQKILESTQSIIQEKGVRGIIDMYGGTVLFDGVIHADKENELKKVEKYGIYSEIISFLDKPGMTYILKNEPNGILLYVKDITVSDEKLENEQLNKEFNEIVNEKLSLETNALVASFYRNATIEISELIQGNRSEE